MAAEKGKERKAEFTTSSGIVLKNHFTPADAAVDYTRDLGEPGEYPFTRGVYRTMYRGRFWTMRQYAGFSTAKESNARYKYLLSQGTTGLSVAFDLPTQIGYDSDHPMALGEVGKVGVAIDSLADMEELFDGIPLERVSTSMTINATASILLALYVAVAKKQGVAPDKLNGTIQNDILKEYIARGTYIYPPKASLRIITDIFAYCAAEVPNWNTISISGYHIREAGSTAAQEIAFTLADGTAYVQAAIDAEALGEGDERALRRAGREVNDAALPHADRRLDAHRAAARSQRRPHDDSGSGGGARRHAVAAHEQHGRGAEPADRRRGARRAQNAAGHRLRIGRGRHRRRARRFLRGRASDERA
jgi:methylmalonyl-CoA mutase N-terminal domain/subunit